MSERDPEISVLTPSYGYARFISAAILSVLDQKGIATEHLVQDGVSQDETVKVLESFGTRVEWSSEADEGQSDALNKALPKARGAWVGWLNADEFYLPGGLRALMEAARATGADVVYGDTAWIDESGRMLRLDPQYSFSARVLRLYGPFISSCSVIMKRSIMGTAPWDTSLERVMDWDLYLRLLARGARFAYTAYPVGAFRVHDRQVTAGPHTHEMRIVRRQYSIPNSRLQRAIGRSLHRGHKIASGAYARQLRARTLKGTDLRWFATEAGADGCRELLRCYGRSQA